jgi:hypothetical protein
MITIEGQVYDGVMDKPSLDEYIEHLDHKYISKHKGKNGKWIYIYRKAKNLYERGKRNIGLKTGKYSRYNEDFINTKPDYLQRAIRQTGNTSRVIIAGPNGRKGYQHFEDDVYDNARTSHYDKHSKFERQAGYAMNNDPRYKKKKKK